jgi:hypothetical protein
MPQGPSLRTLALFVRRWWPVLRLGVSSGAMAGLSACYVFTPRSVDGYDSQCDIAYRKLELTVEQHEMLVQGRCSNRGCTVWIAINILVTPVSAIVSGSMVVVGNTVFWMERKGRCLIQT